MIRIKNRNICMVRNALSILCYVSFYRLNAQFTLTGRLTDKQEQPIEYAEVSIKNVNDSIKMMTTLTDKMGNFSLSIPKGAYLLSVDYLGQNLLKKKLSVMDNINLRVLKVNTINRIGEVMVTGEKPLIERKIDRLVFNVENSISASGGDALDALKVTPGIRVQNDEITMIGKSGLSVMVDDRLIRLSGEDLTNYLQSLSAEDIKSIEVITTPPAKYEAEGNSGLINIILKKVQKDYLSGNIGSTYTQSTYPKGNLRIGMNYKKNKLSSYTNLNGTYGSYAPRENQTFYSPAQTWSNKSVRRDYLKFIIARTGIDYKISKKSSIGVQYLGEFTNPEIGMKSNNRNTIINNSNHQIDSLISTKSLKDWNIKLNDLNAYYTIKLDSLGKEITADFDYFLYNKDNDLNNRNQIFSNKLKEIDRSEETTNSTQKIDIISSKIDAILPTEQFNFSFGGKISFIKTKNQFNYHTTKNQSALSNHFLYKENIQALYASAERSLNKWDFKLGGRLEITQTEGTSNTLNQPNVNNYVKFFPTLYTTYKPGKNNSYSLNYGKRVNRPNYRLLDPFRWYLNPSFYAEGNPFLQPYITHNVEFSHLWKNNLNTKIYFTSVRNQFGQITLVDKGANIRKSTYQNMINEQTAGLNQSYTLKSFNWLKSYLQYNLSYSKVQSLLIKTVPDNERLNFYFSVNNQLYLTKKWTAEINYWYFSGNSGINYFKGVGSLDMALKGLFFNKKMMLSIAFNDILKTNRSKFKTKVQDEIQTYNNYYDYRKLRISLSYKFGNKKIRSKSKKFSNEEERRRVN